jgi:ubiquinone/menaquinone biosynthesis C-methylase UbiE
LVDETRVCGPDATFRRAYDQFPRFHDPAVRFLLPLLQGSSVEVGREAYMKRIALGGLRARCEGAPLRILEVGVGAGANLPLLEREIPSRRKVEIWGVDLSEGMLRECQRRLTYHPGRRVRLLQADAHALPFPDGSFDRVFHIGGIGSYRDPRQGLAEMARVARPRTPIVVVDEQLDPARRHSLLRRLAFRAITLLQDDPCTPTKLLPAQAIDVREEQISAFYYCLSFRMP